MHEKTSQSSPFPQKKSETRKTPVLIIECKQLVLNSAYPLYSQLVSRACSCCAVAHTNEQMMHNCHMHINVQVCLYCYLLLINIH